ncbi:hypothetical protein RFI_23822, partial [Reticulomyxa filosa]
KKKKVWAKSQVAEMYQAQVMDAFKKNSIDGRLFTTSVLHMEDIRDLGIPNIPAGQIFNAYFGKHAAEIKKKLEKNHQNWNPGATDHEFKCSVTNGKNTTRVMMKKTMTIRQIRNMINETWSLNDNEYELIGSGHTLAEPDKTLEQYGIIDSTVFACIRNTHGGGSVISSLLFVVAFFLGFESNSILWIEGNTGKEDTGKEYVKRQNVRKEYVSKRAIAKKDIPKEDIGKEDEQRVRHFNPKKNPEIKLATERDIITLDDNELILRAQMPCGHAIGAQTMYEYIKWRLSKDLATTDICCPDPKCARKWDWSLVAKVADLSISENLRYQQIMTDRLMKRNGVKKCPNCKSLREPSESLNIFRCNTKKKKSLFLLNFLGIVVVVVLYVQGGLFFMQRRFLLGL